MPEKPKRPGQPRKGSVGRAIAGAARRAAKPVKKAIVNRAVSSAMVRMALGISVRSKEVAREELRLIFCRKKGVAIEIPPQVEEIIRNFEAEAANAISELSRARAGDAQAKARVQEIGRDFANRLIEAARINPAFVISPGRRQALAITRVLDRRGEL